MRRHLFGGWALLTFLAARAREGTLQIFVPWITNQEVLTGIRDQVEDLTARKKLETGLAEIAKGQADDSPLSALQLAAQQTRERIYLDTRNKYEAWISSAQAEILPMTTEQANGAWKAYFAGAPPFRHPKSRTDLPDAFAFQALVELAGKIGPVHFIVEDTPSRFVSAVFPNRVSQRRLCLLFFAADQNRCFSGNSAAEASLAIPEPNDKCEPHIAEKTR